MSETIVRDNYFLLYSLIMGVAFTCLYDLLRIFRKIVHHGNFWQSLEDLFYWVVIAISVFYLMQKESNGSLRWFAILGAFVGMFLYKKLLGELFVNSVSAVLLFLIKYISKVLFFIFTPVRFLGRKIKKGMHFVENKGNRGAKRVKKKLTGWLKTLKMALRKQ